MEPRIQYAKTSDGVSIAYYAVGKGHPVVYVYLPNTHIEFEWRRPEVRRNIEGAARVCTYIRYDPRGFGMYERGVTDFAIDALLQDIDAIVDRLDLSKFALVAGYAAVPLAVAYAARNS